MFRIVRDVKNQFVGVAVFLADDERDAAGESFFHQPQVLEPDLFFPHPGMHLAVNHRDDHRVIRRLDILLQQRLLGRSAQRRLLRGNEAFGKHCLCHRFLRMKESLQVSLVLLADIQIAAKVQKLADRNTDAHMVERLRRGPCHHKTRARMVGPFAFASFEVVQCGFQQRYLEHLE